MPCTPGYITKRNVENEVKIDNSKQTRYRSGIGILLYLVKHSRPDLANPTRELSKVMDGANDFQYRELCRVLKFTWDTKIGT